MYKKGFFFCPEEAFEITGFVTDRDWIAKDLKMYARAECGAVASLVSKNAYISLQEFRYQLSQGLKNSNHLWLDPPTTSVVTGGLSQSPSRRSSPRKSSSRPQVSSDSEPDFIPKKKSKPSTSRSSSKSDMTTKKSDKEKDSPVSKKASKKEKEEKEEKPPLTEEEKKKKASNFAKLLAHQSSKPRHLGEKRLPIGAKDCLAGLTFVPTGVLDSLERDSCKTLVEKYGGKFWYLNLQII